MAIVGSKYKHNLSLGNIILLYNSASKNANIKHNKIV